MTEIGFLYENGIYFEKNLNKAKTYYKKAIQCKDPLALNNLAVLYLKNNNSKSDKDLKKIFNLFQ